MATATSTCGSTGRALGCQPTSSRLEMGVGGARRVSSGEVDEFGGECRDRWCAWQGD